MPCLYILNFESQDFKIENVYEPNMNFQAILERNMISVAKRNWRKGDRYMS